MYYEEKLINGIMCWRSNPDDEFKPYTIEQLSARYQALKDENSSNQAYREMAESGLFSDEEMRM